MTGVCPCCGQATKEDGELLVSLDTNVVSRGGISVRVTPQQAELMFILRTGRVVRLDNILARIYGAGDEPGAAGNTLKVHISRLRRLLRPLGVSIENVRAVGYRLILDDVVPSDEPMADYLAGLAAIQAAAA